jgi:hypothetical protein
LQININLQTILILTISFLLVVCDNNTLKSQGLDVLRLASTHINAEINLQNNNEIYQPNDPIQLQVTSTLSHSRNLSPIKIPFSQRITKNLNVHVGVYPTPPPNGSIITPNSKRSDTTKNQPEYENEFSITASTESQSNFQISIPAPKKEGVYEIIVSIYMPSQTPLPRSFSKPEAELIKQIVVVSPESKQKQQQNQQQQNQQNQQNQNQFFNNLNIIDKELIEQNNTQKNEWWKPNFKRLSTIPTIPAPKLPGFIDYNSTANIISPDNFRFAVNKNSLEQFFEFYINQSSNISDNNNTSKSENNNNSILHPSDSLITSHSWHAVSINLNEIGKPHLIEIDYPASASQKLEIAVVETVDNEHVVSAESCIHVTATVGQAVALLDSTAKSDNTHQILFWSKTKTPTLVFINRTKQNCFFNNIRVYKINPESIQRQYKHIPKRLVAGYLNRSETLLQLASTIEKSAASNANINAAETPKILARDWQTLYESATRLVDTLHWNGFDGLMLNVASNDTILCKTNALQTELNHDMLELLHRLFNRETFSLIPAINFNMRLPKIDNLIRNNPQLANELLQNNSEISSHINLNNNVNTNETANINTTSNNIETNNQQLRYNLLHPLVKESILNTISEITARYGIHSSFGGIGIILSQDSYMLLNEPLKSLDDYTMREFVKETRTHIPDTNFADLQDRINARMKFFRNNNEILETFINWRNVKVKEFYQDIVKTITANRRDARLYIAADSILNQPEVKKFCLPTLPRSSVVLLSQRMLGYDPALFCDIPSVTFLRPSRRSPEMQTETAAVYSDFDTANTGTKFIRDGISFGVLFFNDPEQSPSVPVSILNRLRFVKQLAQSDVAMFFDGGNSLTNGEKDSLNDLFAAFRQLPALPFNTFSYPSDQSSDSSTISERSLQPVIIRYVNGGSGLFVYIVNDAPFEVRVDIDFKVAEGVGFYELSGRKKFETGTWNNGRQRSSFRIEPYNLAAIYVDDAAATINDVDVLRPEYICGVNGILHKWVEQLGQRIQVARTGVRWDKLINAGFDDTQDRVERNFKKTEFPKTVLQNPSGYFDANNYEYSEYRGWQALSAAGTSANIDSVIKHNGNASLKLTSTSLNKNICVSSDPFELPSTGRLFVSFFVAVKGDFGKNNEVTPNLSSPNLSSSNLSSSNLSTANLSSPNLSSSNLSSGVISSRSMEGLPLLFQVSIIGVDGSDRESKDKDKDNAVYSGNGGDILNRTFNMESFLRPVLKGGVLAGGEYQWFKAVIPFDRLPMSDDRKVTLRFSLSGAASVWIDEITLYQVAFTPEETNELFRLISAADVRRSKCRISDLMTLFDSYWVQFLLHNIPDQNNSKLSNRTGVANNSPSNISSNAKVASNSSLTSLLPSSKPSDKPVQSGGIINRVKSWIKWK